MTLMMSLTSLSWAGGGFTPADIPNAVAWYQADLGITLNGGDVSDWADQIGTNDLTQATAADQPLYDVVNANYNNQSTINFTGSTSAESLDASSFTTLTQPYYIFSVATPDNTSGGGFGRIHASNDGTLAGTANVHDTSQEIEINAGTQVITTLDAYTVPNTTPTMIGALYDGASTNINFDGTSQVTGSGGTGVLNGTTGFRVGNRSDDIRCWSGDIALIVVVNANPSNAMKNNLGNYAADLYGLTWTDL